MIIFLAAAHRPYHDTQEICNYPAPRPSVFGTFFEIGTRNDQQSVKGLRRLHEADCPLIMLDSGAHSFFSLDPTIRSASAIQSDGKSTAHMPTPHEYFERYYAWLAQTKDDNLWDYAFELDLDKIVGYPTVVAWRQRLADAGLAHRLIPVWHTSLEPAEWPRLVAYALKTGVGLLGIEGPAASGGRLDYQPYVKYAYHRGVRVHIFAAVKRDIMANVPCYSVDSSSWKSVYRFGLSAEFVPQRGVVSMASISFKSQRAAPLSTQDVLNLNDELATAVAEQNLTAATIGAAQPSIRAYLEMQAYYTALWQSRGVLWEPLPRHRSTITSAVSS